MHRPLESPQPVQKRVCFPSFGGMLAFLSSGDCHTCSIVNLLATPKPGALGKAVRIFFEKMVYFYYL